uniref:Uncharacterized protein n=1 Tax=Rhizophora mucronata TaxID=61149 RepID=A0A2P2MY98_RHIMU
MRKGGFSLKGLKKPKRAKSDWSRKVVLAGNGLFGGR